MKRQIFYLFLLLILISSFAQALEEDVKKENEKDVQPVNLNEAVEKKTAIDEKNDDNKNNEENIENGEKKEPELAGVNDLNKEAERKGDLRKAKGLKEEIEEHRKKQHKHHHPSDGALLLLFLIIIGFQIGLHYWKTKHNQSYIIVSLVGMVCFPFYISWKLGYWRMLFVLSWFMLTSGYLIYKTREKPLNVETPKMIYTWFFNLYRICNACTIVGYGIIIFECLGFGFIIGIDFMGFGVTLMFYGLYYGLLGRDSAELCCDFLSTGLGFAQKGGLPTRAPRDGFCSLCTKALEQKATDFTAAVPAQRCITLQCKHVFHEFCLKGWVMVGKKDTCPVCREKVDLSAISTNPWEKQQQGYTQILDALRYLIVWNPVIIFTANFAFSTLGVNMD